MWLYRPTCRARAVAAVHGGPADSRAGLHSGVATSAATSTGRARAALASAAVDAGAGTGGWKRAVLSMLMAAGLAVALVVGMPSVAYARQLLPVEAAPATLEMKVRCADGRICLATGWRWVGLWVFLRASQGVCATVRGLCSAECVFLRGTCPHKTLWKVYFLCQQSLVAAVQGFDAMRCQAPKPSPAELSPEELQTVALFQENTPSVVNIANIGTASC